MSFPQIFSCSDESLLKTIKRLPAFIILLAMVCISADLTAQQRQRTPQKPIDEQAEIYRNGIFEAINYKYGILNGMSQGQLQVNDALFAKSAQDMNALAGMILEGFVFGSPKYPGLTTDAVWEDKEDFFELIEDFQQKAAALAAVADKGVAETKSEVTSLKQTCGGCHRNYRERVN